MRKISFLATSLFLGSVALAPTSAKETPHEDLLQLPLEELSHCISQKLLRGEDLGIDSKEFSNSPHLARGLNKALPKYTRERNAHKQLHHPRAQDVFQRMQNPLQRPHVAFKERGMFANENYWQWTRLIKATQRSSYKWGTGRDTLAQE